MRHGACAACGGVHPAAELRVAYVGRVHDRVPPLRVELWRPRDPRRDGQVPSRLFVGGQLTATRFLPWLVALGEGQAVAAGALGLWEEDLWLAVAPLVLAGPGGPELLRAAWEIAGQAGRGRVWTAVADADVASYDAALRQGFTLDRYVPGGDGEVLGVPIRGSLWLFRSTSGADAGGGAEGEPAQT